MNKIFGYIRVSSKPQNIDRQLEDLLNLGINERDIFIDYESGKDFNRKNYQALKLCLRKGDLIYIKSIDRLGRNYKEILNEWDYIVKTIGADIKVIDMPLLDTTQYKDILGDFVSNLVLDILSFVAEIERTNSKQRQKEGIAIAQRKGVKFGRPTIQIPDQFGTLYDKWVHGSITTKEFMSTLNMKKTTFYKIKKEYESTLI